MEMLHIAPVSKASAAQRAGRAGRVRSGKCFRLLREIDFDKLQQNTTPELQRANILTIVVHLKALGVDDIVHFDFLSPPPLDSLLYALETLHALKVLDSSGRLSEPLGTSISEFPLDPLLAIACLSSDAYDCTEDVLSVAALLSLPPAFHTVRELQDKAAKAKQIFAVAEGDHVTLLNVMTVYLNTPVNERETFCNQHCLNSQVMRRSLSVRQQLHKYMKRFKHTAQAIKAVETTTKSSSDRPVPGKPNKSSATNGKSDADTKDGEAASKEVVGDEIERLVKCFASAYFPHAGMLQFDGSYKMLRGGTTFHLHPSSVLTSKPPKWVVFHEIMFTTRPFARYVSEVQPTWLLKMAPDFFQLRQKPM
eukprot:c7266_g1_i1.p1 GENE.c7266_g1_i1~~c7266_g1_i1.p1  ORF type:complete len:365 (+),score=75.31 c7266_g1_i1:285-1379(+)